MISPDQLFDRAGQQVPVRGRLLLGLGLACWVGAAVALALAKGPLAAGLIAAAWLLTELGAARMRAEGRGSPSLSPLGLLVVPFGFVLADPGRALAGMFLTFALAVWFTAGKSFGRSWFGGVSTLGFGAVAILPYYLSPLAYLIGVIAFVLAGQGAVRR